MTSPGFGDRVRIAGAPETEASGFAGRIGEVWGKAVPSLSNVGPVIGDRGEDVALSVLFEGTEDEVWFAPHLVKRIDRRSRLVPLALVAAFALPIATAIPDVGKSAVHRLPLVRAPTPCFQVQGYVTSGVYPNVRGSSWHVARTNIALRAAVVADQRTYAASARAHVVPSMSGIYETAIDQRLISASSVVVSALIPVFKLYPGGTQGQGWIATTIEVRSGRSVSLRGLLANPRLALKVLAKDWKARLPRSMRRDYVAEDPTSYTPTLAHYRYFALTPEGLAFGFPQEPSGSRFAAVVPYPLVHPYLSLLGRRLVAGVRRPRPVRTVGRGDLAWARLQGFFPGVPRDWPLACD